MSTDGPEPDLSNILITATDVGDRSRYCVADETGFWSLSVVVVRDIEDMVIRGKVAWTDNGWWWPSQVTSYL